MALPAPIFTVITINFNNAAELAKTIESVRSQTFVSKEYLVIDGGSTDDSLSVVEIHRAGIDRFVSERDRGVYDAMNKGVLLARGEWVLFLNSGDFLAGADSLARVAVQVKSSAVDVLLGDAVVRYPDSTTRIHSAEQPSEILYGMICSHQSMFVRRPLLAATPFSVGKMRSDYEFTLKAWRRGLRFQKLGFVTASVSAGGWSDRKRIRSLSERWVLLRESDLLSGRLIFHFCLLFFLAFVSSGVKSILPERATSAIRAFKNRHLNARRSCG